MIKRYDILCAILYMRLSLEENEADAQTPLHILFHVRLHFIVSVDLVQ